MISKIKPVLILISFILALLFSSSSAFAQEENAIKISGYSPTRSGSPLLDTSGNPYVSPAGPSTGSNILGSSLLDSNRFGPEGTVKCAVDFQIPTNYISEGSLVDDNGSLKLNVFFATNTTQSLTQEEITELKKFINAGGVVFAHTTSSGGDQYVPLFQELGLDISFGERQQVPTSSRTSDPVDNTPTTNGPFGPVPSLFHGPFRSVESSGVNIVAYDLTFGKTVLADTSVGQGYLAVSGSPLHANVVALGSNIRYFANLVALGCKNDSSIVLPVPSFKQGLPEYDGVDPIWENLVYDHGDALALSDCNRNGDIATIAECGCALTSAAMVMKYHGIESAPNGFTFNPAFLNLFANETLPDGVSTKGFFGGSFNWDYAESFSAAAAAYNDSKKVEKASREDFDVGRIKELIDAGQPVIVKVAGRWGVHWVVVKGYDPDTNRLIISDPAKPDPTPGEYAYLDENYTPYPENSIVVYKKTSSDFRRLQFATVSQNHLLVTDSLGNKTGYDPETGQILEEIPNSEYVLDLYYGDPTSGVEASPSTEGVYYLTLKLPEDGEYKMQIVSQDGEPHPVQVYSSDIEGGLAGKTINPDISGNDYTFVYKEENAGEIVSAWIDAAIDIKPSMKTNILAPPNRKFPIPVAILGSETFEVARVDQNSLTFGKSGDEQSLDYCASELEDVNKDERLDLACYFSANMLGLNVWDTEAVLKGMYEGGISFSASDSVWLLKSWFLF